MKHVLLVAGPIALVVMAALYGRSDHRSQPGAGPLRSELSMVQIEQMRVMSPDSNRAAQLVEREEKLKYELFGRDDQPAMCPVPAPAPQACIASTMPLLRALRPCGP